MANIQFYLILFTAFNIFLLPNAKYIGSPTKGVDLKITLNRTLELKCEYTGEDANGQFLGWYKDDELIVNDKAKHYVVKTSKKESKLSIVFMEADQTVKKWSVKTNKLLDEKEPIECQFSKIKLIPAPQRMKTNLNTEQLDSEHTSVRRLNNEPVNFKCIIEPNRTNSLRRPKIRWEFSKNGVKFTRLPPGVHNISEDEISIERVNKTHRGYYRCKLNSYDYTALLRVKDPLVALWPFLCIVSAVLILVTVILIYEKRQRAAKKAAALEDEVNDSANDPLVRSSNKLSDNENKKLTVTA